MAATLLQLTLLYLFFLTRSAFVFDSPLVLAIVHLQEQYLRHTDDYEIQPTPKI
jgi:hypothetical protein